MHIKLDCDKARNGRKKLIVQQLSDCVFYGQNKSDNESEICASQNGINISPVFLDARKYQKTLAVLSRIFVEQTLFVMAQEPVSSNNLV